MSTHARPSAGEIGSAMAELVGHVPDARRLWISAQADRVELWLETADIRLHLRHPRRLTLPIESAIPPRAIEIPRRAA